MPLRAFFSSKIWCLVFTWVNIFSFWKKTAMFNFSHSHIFEVQIFMSSVWCALSTHDQCFFRETLSKWTRHFISTMPYPFKQQLVLPIRTVTYIMMKFIDKFKVKEKNTRKKNIIKITQTHNSIKKTTANDKITCIHRRNSKTTKMFMAHQPIETVWI